MTKDNVEEQPESVQASGMRLSNAPEPLIWMAQKEPESPERKGGKQPPNRPDPPKPPQKIDPPKPRPRD